MGKTEKEFAEKAYKLAEGTCEYRFTVPAVAAALAEAWHNGHLEGYGSGYSRGYELGKGDGYREGLGKFAVDEAAPGEDKTVKSLYKCTVLTGPRWPNAEDNWLARVWFGTCPISDREAVKPISAESKEYSKGYAAGIEAENTRAYNTGYQVGFDKASGVNKAHIDSLTKDREKLIAQVEGHAADLQREKEKSYNAGWYACAEAKRSQDAEALGKEYDRGHAAGKAEERGNIGNRVAELEHHVAEWKSEAQRERTRANCEETALANVLKAPKGTERETLWGIGAWIREADKHRNAAVAAEKAVVRLRETHAKEVEQLKLVRSDGEAQLFREVVLLQERLHRQSETIERLRGRLSDARRLLTRVRNFLGFHIPARTNAEQNVYTDIEKFLSD